MLLGIVTIPAIVNVGIGYVTRDRLTDRIEIVTYREYVGVSAALLLFVAIVRARRDVPRPAPARAAPMFARPLTGTDYAAAKFGSIFTLLFAFSFLPRSCCSSATCWSATAPGLLHEPTSTCCGRCRWRSSCSPPTTPSSGSPIASLTDRRIVAGAAIIGLFLVTSVTAAVLVAGIRT